MFQNTKEGLSCMFIDALSTPRRVGIELNYAQTKSKWQRGSCNNKIVYIEKIIQYLYLGQEKIPGDPTKKIK